MQKIKEDKYKNQEIIDKFKKDVKYYIDEYEFEKGNVEFYDNIDNEDEYKNELAELDEEINKIQIPFTKMKKLLSELASKNEITEHIKKQFDGESLLFSNKCICNNNLLACYDIAILKDKNDPVNSGLDQYVQFSYLIDLDNNIFCWSSNESDNFNVIEFKEIINEKKKYIY